MKNNSYLLKKRSTDTNSNEAYDLIYKEKPITNGYSNLAINLYADYSKITQDLIADLYARKGKIPTDKTFLAQMVYYGKQLYLKDVLTPDADDATKMGYTPEQIKWCKENEAEIWRYFVERNMLYDTDANLLRRFILPSPFSKFYLDLDNESPGRIGVWMGWQMVKSYMKNNDVSLQQLLDMDEKELFLQSKYKPKK